MARLAEVSHLTYVRQKHRDQGVPLQELTLEVTDHDRERAEDTVAELERIGVYPGPGSDTDSEHREPAAGPAAPSEPEGKPITDIWGRPIRPRGRRGR